MKMVYMDIYGSMYYILVDAFGAELHHSIQTLRAALPLPKIAEQLKIFRPCHVRPWRASPSLQAINQ